MTDTLHDFREVTAEVWYPAEQGTGVRAPYVPELSRIAKGLAASGEVTPFEVLGLRCTGNRAHCHAKGRRSFCPKTARDLECEWWPLFRSFTI
jgi:hypothetical protein